MAPKLVSAGECAGAAGACSMVAPVAVLQEQVAELKEAVKRIEAACGRVPWYLLTALLTLLGAVIPCILSLKKG